MIPRSLPSTCRFSRTQHSVFLSITTINNFPSAATSLMEGSACRKQSQGREAHGLDEKERDLFL